METKIMGIGEYGKNMEHEVLRSIILSVLCDDQLFKDYDTKKNIITELRNLHKNSCMIKFPGIEMISVVNKNIIIRIIRTPAMNAYSTLRFEMSCTEYSKFINDLLSHYYNNIVIPEKVFNMIKGFSKEVLFRMINMSENDPSFIINIDDYTSLEVHKISKPLSYKFTFTTGEAFYIQGRAKNTLIHMINNFILNYDDGMNELLFIIDNLSKEDSMDLYENLIYMIRDNIPTREIDELFACIEISGDKVQLYLPLFSVRDIIITKNDLFHIIDKLRGRILSDKEFYRHLAYIIKMSDYICSSINYKYHSIRIPSLNLYFIINSNEIEGIIKMSKLLDSEKSNNKIIISTPKDMLSYLKQHKIDYTELHSLLCKSVDNNIFTNVSENFVIIDDGEDIIRVFENSIKPGINLYKKDIYELIYLLSK